MKTMCLKQSALMLFLLLSSFCKGKNLVHCWNFNTSTSEATIKTTIPTVSLSISTNVGTERGTTNITVTATASSAVNGNQTLNLGITGAAITAADYTLSSSVVTILSGGTTGTVIFTVVNDDLTENTEEATLTISNPSSGITLGTPIAKSITIIDNETPLNIVLSSYKRVGRYDLPLNSDPRSYNRLCNEASAVTYNWDTDTLFVVGDESTDVVQISKTGQFINTMTLGSGQFYDVEGITYIGGGQFVMSEEGNRTLVKFTYAAGTTLLRSATQTVTIGTPAGNFGTEGLSYDPLTGGYIVIREDPIGIFQTGVDFNAGTATNGSATTVNSTNLFDPALLGPDKKDVADVYALSNLNALNGQPLYNNLLVLEQEQGKVVNIDRSGTIANSLIIVKDAGEQLSVGQHQHEGLTMDRDGILYIVSENGGGSDIPQLWVYAPFNSVPDIALANTITSISENSNTSAAVKVSDIIVTDDGLGTNTLTLSGTDANIFTIIDSSLYIKSGTVLDYEIKTSYSVTINVDDPTLGTNPDDSVNYVLSVTNENEDPTTWNGSSWSNGDPTKYKEVFINRNYNTGIRGGFTAKKLTVNTPRTLRIATGQYVGNVTVHNEIINNGTIVVENNTNLIQVNDGVANSGAITVNRNSNALKRGDYTLWSSPVASQNLAAFSPLTSLVPNRFYIYNPATDKFTNTVPVALNPTTTNFSPGVGYAIRMPNENPAILGTSSDYYLGNASITYNGVFTGIPNNGDVSVTLSRAGQGYNLVGNPYPSAINLFTLKSNNNLVIGNTFYMWRKTNNGTGSAYCSYVPTTASTGTFVSNNNAQAPTTFVGDIQVGQGFFVSALTTGPLVFKNGQRVPTASSFFKTKQPAAHTKVWLNATNLAGYFSQMAVTYFDGATVGIDDFDGKYISDSAFALTSNINNGDYTIQGRPAFDASDIVALNFKTDVTGEYTIAIDHAEGVFASGQDIYLIDSKTGIETNLKTSSYPFTATAGVDNARFSLKYQQTLNTDKQVLNDNSVIVYKNNGVIHVNSVAKTINNVKVFDVQGKLLAERNNVKANTTSIQNLSASNQILIVTVTTDDNQMISKKVEN